MTHSTPLQRACRSPRPSSHRRLEPVLVLIRRHDPTALHTELVRHSHRRQTIHAQRGRPVDVEDLALARRVLQAGLPVAAEEAVETSTWRPDGQSVAMRGILGAHRRSGSHASFGWTLPTPRAGPKGSWDRGTEGQS